MSKEQSPTMQKGPTFDDILQMLKKSFIEETKELREELMDWKVKCKELEKQNNILDYRIKGSSNRISELEKKLEETEELKNSTMRKYYDLKRDYDDLNQFKTSITHMVSPTKDKTKQSINPATNLTSKFSSPEVRKTSSFVFNSEDDLCTPSNHSNISNISVRHDSYDPILTSVHQRNKYGSDSPIIFNRTPQKSRDQTVRSRSATLSNRKRTSILKDPSSFTSREKNVKFSPSTKTAELGEKEVPVDTPFSAPPTPHSSFGVQYTKKPDLKEESHDKVVADRFVSTPSRRTYSSQESANNYTKNSNRLASSIASSDLEEISADVTAQELYLRVKKALSPDEFKNFSTNIRKLNMGEQSITTTLVNLREIIGEERQNLYSHLKRVISAGEM
ncbi:predicted protein [Naegleria gruberi]|uniref:Predicted protein n=1 Tax=Naegleria gruberi TaxID=5762 RepID=D2UY87_NAEGR|nr:uncharacterized protein NAEGRDRAFT_45119 [Naegleria gruberi]EFC50429.1 predicted protein [Naegleria gruberi]|eukprot:XP_002683173.1 predicted protein [Naegleria gruberi strain NEG-M]